MGTAIRLREDFSAVELRRLAARSSDGGQARRLLSLAAVRDGASRQAAARIGGMDRQTLRDWVHAFNARGPAGLINATAPGPLPRLNREQKQALARIVERGPDREIDGVVRWRCADLKVVIMERFGVGLSEVQISRILKELGFSHISARARHPGQDKGKIEEFKKTLPQGWRKSRPDCRQKRP